MTDFPNYHKPFNAPHTAKSANVTECPTRNATGARLLFRHWIALLTSLAFSKEFTVNSSQWSTWKNTRSIYLPDLYTVHLSAPQSMQRLMFSLSKRLIGDHNKATVKMLYNVQCIQYSEHEIKFWVSQFTKVHWNQTEKIQSQVSLLWRSP